MANAPRPGASRRADEEKAHITFELEGKRYTIRPSEVSSTLAREYRRETGTSFGADLSLLNPDTQASPDLDTLQNLVWLARRMSGELVKLVDVDDFTYEQMASMVLVDTPVDEEPDSPE